MHIERDDLSRPEVHALLSEHLQHMRSLGPLDSVFALDLTALRAPQIEVWTAWEGQALLGCGALKTLDAHHGEIKSMRTPQAQRRQGAGRLVLAHIIDVARARGMQRLSLETGTVASFYPAHALYRSVGFVECGPFSDYVEDVNSRFMTLRL